LRPLPTEAGLLPRLQKLPYSIRGGILDVFSPEAAQPLRIELFGDQIESIRRFEVESQRSVLKLNECTLLPLTEFQKSRALMVDLANKLREAGMPSRELPLDGQPFAGWEMMAPLARKRPSTLFSLLDKSLIVWDEPDLTRSAAERLWKRLRGDERHQLCPPEEVFLEWEELRSRTAQSPQIEMRELDTSAGALHISTRPAMAFHGNMPAAIAEARTLVESGHQVAFFCGTTGELERVADIFHEYGVPYQLGLDQNETTPEYLAKRPYLAGSVANIYLIRGAIARGTNFTSQNLVLFGSEDLFDPSELVAKPVTGKAHLSTFSADQFDLKPGDYVVHAEHGVARFTGLRVQRSLALGAAIPHEAAGLHSRFGRTVRIRPIRQQDPQHQVMSKPVRRTKRGMQGCFAGFGERMVHLCALLHKKLAKPPVHGSRRRSNQGSRRESPGFRHAAVRTALRLHLRNTRTIAGERLLPGRGRPRCSRHARNRKPDLCGLPQFAQSLL